MPTCEFRENTNIQSIATEFVLFVLYVMYVPNLWEIIYILNKH